jgi:hypothetical protein
MGRIQDVVTDLSKVHTICFILYYIRVREPPGARESVMP